MKIRKAFKYRLKANSEQVALFVKQAGCCRFVWNKALSIQKQRLDAGEKLLKLSELSKLLTGWKREEGTEFLSIAQAQSMQQVLKNIDRAITEFFNKNSKNGFPKFKKKGRCLDSFKYPQNVRMSGNMVFLPKIGLVRFIKSREIEGRIRNATVSRRGGHWYVSIQTEFDIPDPVHPSTLSVGIDLGISRFATLSDGSFLAPLNSFKKLENKLSQEQLRLSNKVRFSANWQKQKKKIAKIYGKITDSRKDYLHKASTTISKNHAIVYVEDLKIANMSKSASGTKDAPGRNVKAKSGLNKAILDQGWFEFRRQLEYKLLWSGGRLIKVPPQNTSRTCHECGCVSKENRKSQSVFKCIKCSYKENADYVAAINIKRAGHARLACEVSGAVMPPAAGTYSI